MVLVDESVASGRFHDVKVTLVRRRRLGSQRWSLLERAVRPVLVVVVDVVGHEPFELVLVPDEGAVEKFAADGPDPALGVGVSDRGADGCLEDLESFGAEDLIERVDELAAAVTYKGARTRELVGVSQEQVAGCLGWSMLRSGWRSHRRRTLAGWECG